MGTNLSYYSRPTREKGLPNSHGLSSNRHPESQTTIRYLNHNFPWMDGVIVVMVVVVVVVVVVNEVFLVLVLIVRVFDVVFDVS